MTGKTLTSVADAQEAAEQAQVAYDQAREAAEKARTDLEVANEDLVQAKLWESGVDVGMDSFLGRLAAWIGEQPDVADLDVLGGGFFGFRLAGYGSVSMTVSQTE
jgi:hypothetical protein